MCRRVQCPKCKKATFAGCGAHVEQVLAGVPAADRCQGHAKETTPDAKEATSFRWPWQR
jgi:hypothetical protein